MIVVLIMVIPIQTWFYQLTGRIYLGAVLNAALVTWMFVSSQVGETASTGAVETRT
jgi:hypothetical protein